MDYSIVLSDTKKFKSYIGTITIKPNEIVLIPAVNMNIEPMYSSYKPLNLKEEINF
ncbi:MAG: hypothetical protein LBJ88_00620 [Campylobacteraceae bacterium]|jgi:hypothetical protein|nr:hypothetical protein [Campylobacteraceae bacterium]